MILTFLYLIFFILAAGYSILILVFFISLYLLKAGTNSQQQMVSVVVAARNEEKNIGRCLDALVNQTYPSDKYEIIIIDDRSDDKTADIIRKAADQNPNIRLIQIKNVPSGISPKKNALAAGIESAKGEIILTTDADCTPVSTWLETMIGYFENNVGLVAGFSPLVGKQNFWSKFVSLDSLSLAAVAAASFGIKKPLTCNGRNLAYRKSVFEQVNGFEEIKHFISGDDDLFLHLVSNQTNWKIRYAFDARALVYSMVSENFKHFANQRIRHASKGFFYSNWLTLSLALVYIFNLLLVALFPVSVLISNHFTFWTIGFGLKFICEFLLLFKMASRFRVHDFLTLYPIAAPLHPVYVTVFGLWGQIGKFKWK